MTKNKATLRATRTEPWSTSTLITLNTTKKVEHNYSTNKDDVNDENDHADYKAVTKTSNTTTVLLTGEQK